MGCTRVACTPCTRGSPNATRRPRTTWYARCYRGVRPALRASSPTLVAIGVFALAHGLVASLVSVRVELVLGASALASGVLAAWALGFIVGTFVAPRLVARVGRGRAVQLAAMVLGATTAALALEPGPAWIALRLVGGAAGAVVFIGMESRLAETGGAQRGLVLGLYVVLLQIGYAVVQPLLAHVAPPDAWPFLASGAVYAASGLSVGASAAGGPAVGPSGLGSLRALPATAKLAVGASAIAGLVSGLLVTMGPVYALRLGMGREAMGTFLAVQLGSGVLLAVPLGALSDRLDGRRALAVAGGALGLSGLGGSLLSGDSPALLGAASLFGAFGFALYPLAVALGTSAVRPTQIVPASALFLLAFGLGSASAAPLGGLAMAAFGPSALPLLLGIVSLGLAGLAARSLEPRRAPAAPARA